LTSLHHCIYFSYMNTIINIKTEKEVKDSAHKLAREMGFSLSAVINAYLRQFIRNKAVNFSLSPNMSSELENLLGGIEYDIQRGRNLSPAVSSALELKKHLSSL